MRNVVTILVLTFIFGALCHVLTQGDLRFGAPPATAMDDYFLAKGQEQVAANNIVTSIVFDYRGFDTLGEATVLFTAVLGVGILMRRLKEEEEETDS